MQNKNTFITAAIPYVNGDPHIGHALEFIQVDALSRYYQQIQGKEHVWATTGSDENSLKNVQAAEKAEVEIGAFVAANAKKFHGLYETLELSLNDFIRTREDRHIKGAQKLWSMFKPEDIYKKSYKGLYCVGCEQFYTEKDAEDGKCPTHQKELDVIEEENYFFALSNYQDQIEKLLESETLHVFPEGRKNEMLSFVKNGLEDFSISRSQERARHWGVPVPEDDSQVMYVWVDALSNYINVLGFADDTQQYQDFWVNAHKRLHIIGKDIARFHTIYWPAMLLSAGLPVPTDVFVHGFFTIEGKKMSKSLGNVIAPDDLVKDFGVDAARYFLLRELPYNTDGDVSKERLEIRYTELANQLGNLVGRVAAMSNKYFDGKLTSTQAWGDKRGAIQKKLTAAMEQVNFKQYIDTVWELVGEANETIDKEAPFRTVKTDEDAAKDTLSRVANHIEFIATALLPIIPKTATEILRRYTGEKILVGDPLFPRREA